MGRLLFTPEEQDQDFCQKQEEIVSSRKLDRKAAVAGMDPKKRKIAEYQAAYRKANKDKIAERNAAYYKANKDKIAERNAAYRDKNRAAYNAYMREYKRKRREARKAAHE